MNLSAAAFLLLASVLLVIGVALFSPRSAVVAASLVCLGAGVALLDVGGDR